jgi:putative nucleotidyltransferase with HDIG domain
MWGKARGRNRYTRGNRFGSACLTNVTKEYLRNRVDLCYITHNLYLGGYAMESRLEILRHEVDKLIMATHANEIYSIRKRFGHFYGVSFFCTLLAVRRNLNEELATTCGLLHDIGYLSGSNGENHAKEGAEKAEVLLRTINLHSDEEINIIIKSISRHSDKHVVHEPYDELLKDADVMSACFYNEDLRTHNTYITRYNNIFNELGCDSKE